MNWGHSMTLLGSPFKGEGFLSICSHPLCWQGLQGAAALKIIFSTPIVQNLWKTPNNPHQTQSHQGFGVPRLENTQFYNPLIFKGELNALHFKKRGASKPDSKGNSLANCGKNQPVWQSEPTPVGGRALRKSRFFIDPPLSWREGWRGVDFTAEIHHPTLP
jgi:hypothetical protein